MQRYTESFVLELQLFVQAVLQVKPTPVTGADSRVPVVMVAGDDPLAGDKHQRRWWEVVIMLAAAGIFFWLAVGTRAQHIYVNFPWMIVLIVGTIIPLGLCGTLLWRRTRFS
jgi:hypothetical protein